jgi:uncharacterized protein YggU (UPF0235/DUF167 family)
MTGDDDNIRLAVRLTPKAAKSAINGWARDVAGAPYLKVSVTAAPDKGKANKALIDLLAQAWGLPKSRIALIRGETDRNKVLILHQPPALLKHRITNCE